MTDGTFSGIAGMYRHFRFGGIGLLASDVERGMADGHGGNATKDGGMRFAFRPTLAAILMTGSIATASLAKASGISTDCRNSSAMVGQSFVVYGRLSVYNGTPSIRIWKIGTNQILGVLDGTGQNAEGPGVLPESVSKLLNPNPFGTVIFGDYTVCPLTVPRSGEMQMVYIVDAVKLVPGRFPN